MNLQRYQTPVVTSLWVKVPLQPATHFSWMGMHGLAANIAMTEADFTLASVVVLMTVWQKPKIFCYNAKAAHIDIDPAEIGKIMQIFL